MNDSLIMNNFGLTCAFALCLPFESNRKQARGISAPECLSQAAVKRMNSNGCCSNGCSSWAVESFYWKISACKVFSNKLAAVDSVNLTGSKLHVTAYDQLHVTNCEEHAGSKPLTGLLPFRRLFTSESLLKSISDQINSVFVFNGTLLNAVLTTLG